MQVFIYKEVIWGDRFIHSVDMYVRNVVCCIKTGRFIFNGEKTIKGGICIRPRFYGAF